MYTPAEDLSSGHRHDIITSRTRHRGARTGRGTEAAQLLAPLLGSGTLNREDELAVRTALAEAWLLQDDLTQAASALGRTPDSMREPVADARLSMLWRLHGRITFARGEQSRAIALHARALKHAELAHDSRAIGLAHYELALCYKQVGDSGIVRDHLTEGASALHAAARETAAQLEAQVATLTRELEARTGRRRIVGHSPRWKDTLAQAARVAQTETTVLLTGESGTGKEIIARFIHQGSCRKKGPFVAINCPALPDQLLESELFGYERNAFTGATSAKPGRIEQASGGVLFLDEVGEMTPAVQAKLLRVIEEREFQRLGSTRASRADIRVIAATNRDLHAAIRRGQFREDLYYRLGVFEIALPPLRERLDDILELADAFLEEIGESVGRHAVGIARDARNQLLAYAWPGNVRELRNAIERAVILADGGYIRSEHLPVITPRNPATALPADTVTAGGVNFQAIERSLVVKALTQARHNKTRAARLLGLTRAQLYSRIEKYGLAETES